MQMHQGDSIEETIDNVFVMFYFNLCSGDWTYKYCYAQMAQAVANEEYEIAEGIKKAINFKKYGNSSY